MREIIRICDINITATLKKIDLIWSIQSIKTVSIGIRDKIFFHSFSRGCKKYTHVLPFIRLWSFLLMSSKVGILFVQQSNKKYHKPYSSSACFSNSLFSIFLQYSNTIRSCLRFSACLTNLQGVLG